MQVKIEKYALPLVVLMALLLSACGANPFRTVEPVIDTDGDAVIDSEDRCPLTSTGSPVDDSGCSIFKGSIEALEFAPGDDQLNASSRTSLQALVDLLNQHPEVVVQLGGHTDNRGSARDNLALSKRRVMSVVKFLVANGVEGMRLKPLGFGESRPVMSNTTAAGRSQNRRIEMSVLSQ